MIFWSDRKDSKILSIGGKKSCLKYTLNACKVEWEENIFDFYVEPIALEMQNTYYHNFILINSSHLFNSNMRKSVLINLVILSWKQLFNTDFYS